MTSKPTYEELEQRVKALESDLAEYTRTRNNGDLRLSQQYLKAFLDNTNQPIFLKDADFNYFLINSEFERLAHVSNEQIQGQDDFAIFPEPIAELFRFQDLEVKRHKKLIEFKETIMLADGEHAFLTSKFPLTNDQGEVYAVGGVCTDITSLQKAENALRESEKKYRTLVETASLGIQISDLEGRIIFSNPAHHKILGLPEGKIVGSFVWEFIDDEVKKKELQQYYTYIIQKQPRPEPYFTTNRTNDGRQIHVQVDWNYMRDVNEEVYALCSIINNVTDRVKAERALKASELKCRSVIESCPDGIHLYTLEPDGRLIFSGANPAADKILNLNCSQFIGKTVEEAFPSSVDTEIPDRYREACLTGKTWHAKQVKYEDNQITGAYEVHAFQTEPGRMATFFRDISAQLKMEKELQKIQKLESVGILAGGIAHDFNNLLTAIIGNISMAKLYTQTAPTKVIDRLNDAEKASIRARDLTQQLLTFSKGGAPVKRAASINEVIKESTSFMLSGSNVKCSLFLPEQIWPVDIDVGQVSQVIQNVVKNADQAMPEGGSITIRVTNMVIDDSHGLPLPQGKYVHISLADEGTGIPKKYLAKVFDPYFSTKQEGSGLGLAVCHSIINNHDGHMTVESEYGNGTTFHIYLPASQRKPEAKAVLTEESRRSGEKILIMDDDENILTVAVNMLNLMGYKTETARDGTEAISLYKQAMLDEQMFDGVLLDLTIPGGMGGRETLQQLATIDPEIKAIVSSGYTNDPIMTDYQAHGFRGAVTKPYNMQQLGQALRDLFN